MHSNKSIIQKLLIRELNGSLTQKYFKESGKFRIYEKCPEHLQLSLREVISQQNLLLGHVVIGFSRDGRHIISYQCRIIDEMEDGCPYLGYRYFLHWWEFHYKMPAENVHVIPLFADENIYNELHLLICQPPSGKHIIVHGSSSNLKSSMQCGPPSRSLQSSTCYLTVAPSPDTSKSNPMAAANLLSQKSYVLHLKYELVPPYPPFFPSVNLKIDDIILVNSGDFLCALSAYVHIDEFKSNKTFCPLSRMLNPLNCKSNCFCGFLSQSITLQCQCNSSKEHGFSYYGADDTSVQSTFCVNATKDASIPDNKKSTNLIDNTDNLVDCKLYKVSADNIKGWSSAAEQIPSTHTSCYIHFYCHGASNLSFDLTSPFDYTDTAFPVTVTDEQGTILTQTFTHRCSSGTADFVDALKTNRSADVVVKQIVFDAEQFLEEKLQSLDSIKGKYVSLKDYDMQIVQVCRSSRTVIILVKVLIHLNGNIDESSSSPCLSTYMTGFLLAWNIQSGSISVLEEQSFIEIDQKKCKSRSVCHGLEQVVELRKKNFQPSSYKDSVLSFSNHSVFSGRSMSYLLHPFQPLAMVM